MHVAEYLDNFILADDMDTFVLITCLFTIKKFIEKAISRIIYIFDISVGIEFKSESNSVVRLTIPPMMWCSV